MEFCWEGPCFDENTEFNVVVDASAGEVRAGDQGRGLVGDHTFGVEASRGSEERFAGFKGPSVEVGSVLDGCKWVSSADSEWAAGVVGCLENESYLNSPVDGADEGCGELGDVRSSRTTLRGGSWLRWQPMC